MKRIFSTILAVVFSFGLACGFAPIVAASSDGVDSVGRAQAGIDEINPTNNNTDLMGTVRFILNAVFVVVGIIAVIVIIIGGINYMTSQGDPGKVKRGKDTILYGIVGLIIALLAFAIVQFVLNALQ